jgi:hypothetical protein
MTAKFNFTRFGITEDPRGAQVKWTIGDRTYLADVVGFYREEARGVTMLKCRHFCGDDAPDVAASVVDILGWSLPARQ